MELKVSSQKRGLSSSDYASDPEEKEISEDEDGDRNHKHRRREARSQSLEEDSLDQGLARPYRKRNRPFENGYSYRDSNPQSGETWKSYNMNSDRDFPSRFEKRRSNQASFSRAPLDFNPRIRGNQTLPGEAGPFRGRGREPVSWGPRDSRLGLVDVASQIIQPGSVPSGLFAGRGLPNVSNTHGASWNAFGLVPGVPNGGLDALHPLGLQGLMGPAITAPVNIGIARQRCRDFEERGFCLRGDMCPMEHGVNRIVVDDVQSLSQFNLPVSLAGSQLVGTSSGQGSLPVITTASGSSMNSTSFHGKSSNAGMIDDGLGLHGGVVGASDVYDPDQPLWTNDNPGTSSALIGLNQSNAGETESFFDVDQQNIGLHRGFDDEHALRSAPAAGSQSSSVWGRIGSSKNRLGLNEKIDSVGTSSSHIERDIKTAETLNSSLPEGNGPMVKQSSLKPHNDSMRNIRKPSQKALRTLFVNGVPLKDNKREALLSHFQRFGEVIDIYIPMNSERAFVQFSKREEAEAALKAPDAVMGNRFIKLWWANRDNIPDDGINGIGNVPNTPRGMTLNPALSRPFVNKVKENSRAAGSKDGSAHASTGQVPVYDHSKPMTTNGPKAPPVQQKKLEDLELLKEELRKKQEMLEQKRNEFQRQLDKLGKHTAGSKDVAASDLTPKKLTSEKTPDHVKAETFKSSPRDNIITGKTSAAEHSVLHTSTSNQIVATKEPLRPSIHPLAHPAAPFAVNRFKLDNRPTAFRILSPLPAGLADIAALEAHFASSGDLSSVELEQSELNKTNDASVTSEVSARVSFKTRHSAEKAFLHGKCWRGQNLKFMWAPTVSARKPGDGSGNPSASSNTPSAANIEPSGESASTSSQKNAASGSGEAEHVGRESDAESGEREKSFESVPNTSPSEKQLS